MQNDFSVCSACKSKTDSERPVWTISVGSEEVKNNPSPCLIQESNPEMLDLQLNALSNQLQTSVK